MMEEKSFEERKRIDIPDLPLEEFEVPPEEIKSELGIENEYVGSIEFGVVGSGQCGGRLAKSFYDIGYKKTIALNTAIADLSPLQIPEEQKMLIGSEQGSGKSMLKGRRAAEQSAQKIFDKMREVLGSIDKIILCVGFGGGTGAGSLEVLIDLATKYLKDLGKGAKDVIVLAALPTAGELKSSVIRKNNEIVQSVIFKKADKGKVGPIILMDNSKIEKMYRGIPPAKFWSTINDTITRLFQIFNFLSKQESEFTSFDAEDYKAVLNASGLAVMGVTRVRTEESRWLSQALQDNFKKTLLASTADFSSAKEAASIIVGDEEVMSSLSMDVINYGFDAIHNLLGEANLHRGLYKADKPGIRAYTLITGMKPLPAVKNDVY